VLRDKFLALFGKQLMAKKKLDNLSFEESLASLEAIVEQLEHGDLPLEQSMELFEQGLKLSQVSQQKLQQAEQKLQILLTEQGQQVLADFDIDTAQDN
jgi:exodeoxyribonuclease VII small subunit